MTRGSSHLFTNGNISAKFDCHYRNKPDTCTLTWTITKTMSRRQWMNHQDKANTYQSYVVAWTIWPAETLFLIELLSSTGLDRFDCKTGITFSLWKRLIAPGEALQIVSKESTLFSLSSLFRLWLEATKKVSISRMDWKDEFYIWM